MNADDFKKLEEMCSWFANQRGMLCRDYAKELAKIIVKLKKAQNDHIHN